jgi:glycosyltransferase involved in cell wall biosynthesis
MGEDDGVGPEVTVVVIFHNEAAHLHEAITSVAAQTFDRWELVLVDDGSSDASTGIARHWAVEHPDRIRYLDHPGHANRGMSASRNRGVAAARGRYIAYLDGDDTWLAEKLEQQVRLRRQHPTARLVYGPLIRWRSWREPGPAEPTDDDLYGLQGDGVTLTPNRLYRPPELVNLMIEHKDLVPSGALFDRDLFLAVGGAEEAFTASYEDAVVFAKMCFVADAYLADQSWYRYRQRADHGQPAAESAASRVRFLNWVESYAANQDLVVPGLDRALRRARRQLRRPGWHRAIGRAERLGRGRSKGSPAVRGAAGAPGSGS